MNGSNWTLYFSKFENVFVKSANSMPSPKMRVRKRGRGGTKGRHATSSLGASEFTYGTHPPTQEEEEEEEKEDKMVPTHPSTLQDHLSYTLAFQYTPTHQPSSLTSLPDTERSIKPNQQANFEQSRSTFLFFKILYSK